MSTELNALETAPRERTSHPRLGTDFPRDIRTPEPVSGGMTSERPDRSRAWRFRFSLRTLVLVVLCYAGLWTLTAFFARKALHSQILDDLCPILRNYPEGTFVFVRCNPGREVRTITPDEWAKIGTGKLREPIIYLHEEPTAFAPFLYRADVTTGTILQQSDSTFILNTRTAVGGRSRGWYIWFFGLRCRLCEVEMENE
jgi:hypothetical protein